VDRIEPLSLSLPMMAAWGDGVAWGTSGVVGDRAASGDDGLVSKASGDGVAAGDVRQPEAWEWAAIGEQGGRRQKFAPGHHHVRVQFC
jgi:hypothetical protein